MNLSLIVLSKKVTTVILYCTEGLTSHFCYMLPERIRKNMIQPRPMIQGISKCLTLKKRPSVVRRTVINGDGASELCARFLAEDGKPLEGLTMSVDDAGK